MARKPRIVVPNIPHHVTQRGCRRQTVFFCDEDREFYLDLLAFYVRKLEVYLLSYCLMENHVHHLFVPEDDTSLSKLMQMVHMRYARELNKRMEWQGHLWQERFYSSPVDHRYFWISIRYIERNPLEAGIVDHPADYQWSSAAAHCGVRNDDILYSTSIWKKELSKQRDWYEWLSKSDPVNDYRRLRSSNIRSLPCGSEGFLEDIEQKTGHSTNVPLVERPRSV